MSLVQSVSHLKAARVACEQAKLAEQELREKLLADADYQKVKATMETAVAHLNECDAAVREAALAAYEADPSTKKVHPKVSITINRNVVIGEAAKVFTWVKTHLKAAVKVDATMLKRHARAVQHTQPVPDNVARIEEVAGVRIAKEL
jgi:uncharacterized protein YukE